MPTNTWTINQADIVRRREEVKLAKIYEQAYLVWRDSMNMEFQNFGTSPVKTAYWNVSSNGKGYVWKSNKLDEKSCVKSTQSDLFSHGPTMVFRRYPPLSVPEYQMDVLVHALLGLLDQPDHNQRYSTMLLNEAWTINLSSSKQQKEDVMIDAFLRGFGGKQEQLKKSWEDKYVNGIDISVELDDLLKVYTDSEEHLKQKEQQVLEVLTVQMKRYVSVQEDRMKVSKKLEALKCKLSSGKPCSDCDEDDQEGDE